MSAAIDFFSHNHDQVSKELAKNYDQALQFETVTVSLHSPSIIVDREHIARQIFSPIHVDDDTGEPTVDAFSDVFNKGLSINRFSYASLTEVHGMGEDKAERDRETKPNRKYVGVVTAKVFDIRAIVESDARRCFCIYDTSLSNNISHADVCMVRTEESICRSIPKKAQKIQRKKLIKDAFSRILRPES